MFTVNSPTLLSSSTLCTYLLCLGSETAVFLNTSCNLTLSLNWLQHICTSQVPLKLLFMSFCSFFVFYRWWGLVASVKKTDICRQGTRFWYWNHSHWCAVCRPSSADEIHFNGLWLHAGKQSVWIAKKKLKHVGWNAIKLINNHLLPSLLIDDCWWCQRWFMKQKCHTFIDTIFWVISL